MSKFTKQQAQDIARLAKLDLSDAEIDKYTGEIDSILGYVAQLQEEDVSDIATTTNLFDYAGESLQADAPLPGLPIAKILQNATDGRAGKHEFVTSKIVGGEE